VTRSVKIGPVRFLGQSDHQLQAFLDEDDTQSQNMLAKQLCVTQPTISMHLRAMGKVKKSRKMGAA